MTLEQLARAARMSLNATLPWALLVVPRPWHAPRGFPRRELVCVNSDNEAVVSVSAKRLLAWVERNQ